MTKSRAFLPLAFRPAFILIALFLGLLGMHVVGVDHHAPHATHNPRSELSARKPSWIPPMARTHSQH